jgi:lipid-binding SYLF domain-containing protein
MQRIALLSLLLMTLAFGLRADRNDDINRLKDANDVLTDAIGSSDRVIPQELLDKAECVIIVPHMARGAFIIGGRYGRGYMACRKESGRGWNGPGSIRIEGGSIGLQIGGSATDVILLVMNKKGVNKVLSSKFTVGGDAAVAAGPVGRASTAETDALMSAEILSWSKSKGAFAGISLKGSTLRDDEGITKEIWGEKMSNRTIMEKAAAPPQGTQFFFDTLNKYSPRRSD